MTQEKGTTKKKKRHLRKEVIWILHGAFFIAIAIVTVRRVFAAPLRNEYVVGVGAPLPDAGVFVTREAGPVTYASDEEIAAFLQRHGAEETPAANTDELGVHTVYLNYDGKIYTASLVVEDTEAPVIICDEEDTVSVGDNYSFKRHVSVTDNSSRAVSLTIDSSAVDLNKAGDYIITYHAMDMAGNEAKKSAVLHVIEKVTPTPSQEELIISTYADEVLQRIITGEMTPYEKAQAIYDWVHGIEYIQLPEGQSDFDNAVQGFTTRRGDCHVYATTARELLSRAGIACIDIENMTPYTVHAWNLINLGDGWYHFDATRRYGDAYLFYLTDAELMEYSRTHDYTHYYDASLYPEIE